MSESQPKRSPFERYQAYVSQLEEQGKKFPVNQFGDVNFSQIATECGNRRQWFSESAKKVFGTDGQTLEHILRADIQRLGSDVIQPKDPNSVLSEIADTKSKEANLLRTALEQKTKEVEHLRKENEHLQAEIRILRDKVSEVENQKDEMLESGRCFSL